MQPTKALQITLLMQKQNIDIMCLSETHITDSTTYKIKNYQFYFSSSKAKEAKYSGVAIVLSPHIAPYVRQITPINDRIIHVELFSAGAPIHIYSVYAPNQKPEYADIRQKFWKQLTTHTDKLSNNAFYYILGDMNVRIQGRTASEEKVFGPHIWGKGKQKIDNDVLLNRHHAVSMCHQKDLVFANTYKAITQAQQVTYREVGQLPCHPDHYNTTGFQTLDHIICPRRCLPTVLNNKALPLVFFPSDHFLIKTQIRVKLGAKMKTQKPQDRFAFPNDTEEIKEDKKLRYNKIIQQELDLQKEGHTPEDSQELAGTSTPLLPLYVYHTDGSCKQQGNNHQFTPAGWGFVHGYPDSFSPLHYGKVCTRRDSPFYLGARIGSNNTGELSAIAEAALHALETTPPTTAIKIRYDSKWAANIARGKWHPKKHHEHVRITRDLITLLEDKYELIWEWVKGHSGDPGNDLADAAADKGVEEDHTNYHRYHPTRSSLPPEEAYTFCASWVSHKATDIRTRKSASRTDHTEPLDSFNDRLTKAILKATKTVYPAPKFQPRKPWITQATLDLIEQAHTFRENQRFEQEIAKNKEVKKQARKDKKDWMTTHLKTVSKSTVRDKWKGLTQLRKGYQTRQTRLIWEGEAQPYHERANVLASHLSSKQWATHRPTDQQIHALKTDLPLYPDTLPLTEAPFDLTDLDEALAEVKPHKAAGPDGLPADALKLLDDTHKQILLEHINTCFKQKTTPYAWNHATVVSIFKTGKDAALPENYRPISLLQTSYKLYARMLHTRIAALVEPRLRPNQYGFRKARSTGDPIHLTRRIQELYESTNDSLYLLFLDWKQAFDKVSHIGLESSLRRIGITNTYIQRIMQIYEEPTFEVRDAGKTSRSHPQDGGIRQGCPLSPYLFVIFMTVLMHDVDDTLTTPLPYCYAASIPYYDIEYADDTLLIARTAARSQELLTAIEIQSHKYGMLLNADKTVVLAMNVNTQKNITLLDGSHIKYVTQQTYLGAEFTQSAKQKPNLLKRLAMGTREFNKMRSFWNHSDIDKTMKLEICKTIFYPLVMYGLHYSWLTQSRLKQLDAWQARILRRALNIKASMISHMRNETVLKLAKTTPLSEQLQIEQNKYFGHVLRAGERDDPIHTVCFSKDGTTRKLSSRRKIGHPTQKWTNQLVARTNRFFMRPHGSHLRELTTLATTKGWSKFVLSPTRDTPHNRPHIVIPGQRLRMAG